MKARSLVFGILLAFQTGLAFGQETAPASLAGKSAVVVISTGSGNFASIGGYRISFSATNATYTVSPLSSSVLLSAGTYEYTKTGANTGRITATDASVGTAGAQNLVFFFSQFSVLLAFKHAWLPVWHARIRECHSGSRGVGELVGSGTGSRRFSGHPWNRR